MAKSKKVSRLSLIIGVSVIVIGALAAAFWPRAQLVDLGTVSTRPMMMTIDEEGRTRVEESYVISTPFAGRLMRVALSPGDEVTENETVVARMLATNPVVLDARTREQANAAVEAAFAARRLASANLEAATAGNDLAQLDLDRARQLAARGTISTAALERSELAARTASSQLATAQAAIAMRQAELTNAQAQLIGFDDLGISQALKSQQNGGGENLIHAPASGRILRIYQESETTLPVGAPIMEIGDIESGLEVVADLVSADAVRVSEGDRVLIDGWGGDTILEGYVASIDPVGVTKFSALGVEEQRVSVLIKFRSPFEERLGLGHGYRVAVHIITWEDEQALTVPASAVYRTANGWEVFRVVDGAAMAVPVEIGHNNGILAEVTSGLGDKDVVVLYPPDTIVDGAKVAQRSIE